jgi:hypothetical protein
MGHGVDGGSLVGNVPAHDVYVWLLGMADRNVSVCINDAMVVQDVVRGDQLSSELRATSV